MTDVIDALTKGGYLVTSYPTQGKDDARRIAIEQGEQYDRIVCCGGDGTLSETISGLLDLSAPPPLGYIPTGTTNDFSRNLNLPKSLEETARAVASGSVHMCDVGTFNGKSFIYVAAFGAFTSVSYDTPQAVKNIFGHLAYVLSCISQLGSIKHYALDIDYDEGHLDGEFIYGMVSNTISVGGYTKFPIGPVDLCDGRMEVFLVRPPRSLSGLNSIIQSLLRQQLPPNDIVISLQTTHLQITGTAPLPWTLDGEYGGDHESTEIQILPQVIPLIWGDESS